MKALIETSTGTIRALLSIAPIPGDGEAVVDVPDDIEAHGIDLLTGWHHDGSQFVPKTSTVTEARANKLAELAARRYQAETSGVNIAGARILTDRESQAIVTGAWVRMQIAPDTIIDWKGADGWVQLNKTAIEVVAAAVSAHVQACFATEKVHSDNIAALTDEVDIAGYDISVGWP